MCTQAKTTFILVLSSFCFIALCLSALDSMASNISLQVKQSWQEIASEKRRQGKVEPHAASPENSSTIFWTQKHHPSQDDIPEIVGRTSNGSLTAAEVVATFSKRAAYAQKLVGEYLCSKESPTWHSDIPTSSWKLAMILHLREQRNLIDDSGIIRNLLILSHAVPLTLEILVPYQRPGNFNGVCGMI
ncbi:hypothetical protein VTL71DRAFT_6489 [Oculimacula yallundae]|uniref:Uncharacterized protein n=1 Tax=Oculimacula yallundae TaxID=86028 RepID=A0ABR4BX61_9HELO